MFHNFCGGGSTPVNRALIVVEDGIVCFPVVKTEITPSDRKGVFSIFVSGFDLSFTGTASCAIAMDRFLGDRTSGLEGAVSRPLTKV